MPSTQRWPTGGIRTLFVGATAVGVVFYVVRFWTIYAAGELFHRLGFDWTLFFAQAAVVRSGAGPRMYEVPQIAAQLQSLAPYYPGTAPLAALPVPYPPWFAAMMEPFTVPLPPVSFALWLALSIACGGLLAYRVKQFVPELPAIGAVTLIFAAYPVAFGMFMGQVGLILAVAVSEMLVSFQAHRDLRAGLWLSLLLLKPQYAIVFVLLIVFKRRTRAMIGSVLGALALVLLGLLAAGPSAFVRFPAAMAAMADFRNPIAGPWWMINWRAFVLYAAPGLEDEQGLAAVAGLTVLTILLLLYFWRGAFDPDSPEFAAKFAALAVGVLITSYHSHVHGAPLMIVPLAAAWSRPTFKVETRLAILAALYVPTVMLIWVGAVVDRFAVPSDPGVSLWMVWPDALPVLLFVTAFSMICRDVWNLHAPSFRS
jgi:hypothetical protein